MHINSGVVIDVEFGQDVPTDIKTPLESGHGYFHVHNTVNHVDFPSQYESDESDESKLDEAPRVSHYELMNGAEAASLELFFMFVENNVSHNVFDKCVKMMNKYMAECELSAANSLMSYYKMDILLRQEYTVRPVTHDIYERDNMMQLAIILGPEHPKNIASFLEPIVEDLHMLQTSGLRVQTNSGQVSVKVHFVMATGNNPAVSDLMKLAHHNSFFGC
ncbi:hypothetical protein PHYBLDRAFT_63744 [Phycomyces blakesleeanus NRRL 1555(-)]|uniref:Uncharacterized protein n=1 Tax=Phycomyces blakesleeanus (strain ATCC 8743b / DSM 1359 / FGSC 10004 / NBRC 33097 / NRRL 1555) TaxID=763407 RepID=A0A167K4G9_PHYB8|nr:hypothetical protein PHYBLDRAFT_63744 [Phycomyces blakesleeanus NRRL 1555(-)]OAD67260.1 hypothetical protein PHYBLDRAFT_63744 [Phycomyces blakesleeanus NRRL 1555(-)]|eukprot:XP_018285300.1 hypothetical protein PHYBLDRAFT_63744 [Phycomyces blakesleeanus NRRL 1555(-)]